MRITIGMLLVSSAVMASCSSSDTSMEGTRSDGLDVECEPGDEEDVQTCTPEDGDDECEDWDSGGPAIVMWPPNHKLVRFTLDDCAAVQECDDGGEDDGNEDDGNEDDGNEDDGNEDDGADGSEPDAGTDDGGDVIVDVVTLAPADEPVPVAITSITVDEDVDVGGGGDGHTVDFDVAIVDGTTFDLRSERQGGGDGRVYRVYYLDSDNEERTCEFLVPHDRGPYGGAVDSGTVVTVVP